MSLEGVHRIAPALTYSQEQARVSIVAKFTIFKDHERVRRASHLLRGIRFDINE